MPYSDLIQQRKYQAEWMARRRANFFAGKECVDCGVKRDLTLDHIDPRAKIDHRIWSWSQAKRETEISKCMVRCSHCHDVKTRLNGDNLPQAQIDFAQATAIRARYKMEQITQVELAREYGLSRSQVGRIVRFESWPDPGTESRRKRK